MTFFKWVSRIAEDRLLCPSANQLQGSLRRIKFPIGLVLLEFTAVIQPCTKQA